MNKQLIICFVYSLIISPVLSQDSSVLIKRRIPIGINLFTFTSQSPYYSDKSLEFQTFTSTDPVISFSNEEVLPYKLAIDSAKKIELFNNRFIRSVTINPQSTTIHLEDNRFEALSISDQNIYNLGKETTEKVLLNSSKNQYSTLSSHYIDYDLFHSYNDAVQSFELRNCSFKEFRMRNVSIDSMNFQNIKASNIYFDSGSLNNIQMSGILPDTISFINCKLLKWDFDFWTPKDHVIYIDGDFNFEIPLFSKRIARYSFAFGNNIDEIEAEKFLKKILELQKQIGSSDDIKKADILLKNTQVRRGDFFLSLQKSLWLYGYDKLRLFNWFVGLFLFFYLVNLVLFPKLISEVYVIEKLYTDYNSWQKRRNLKVQRLRYLTYVFIYTSLIYFGLRMSIDHFKFNKLWLTIYLYIFYLIGLFFLFYIVSLFLNK